MTQLENGWIMVDTHEYVKELSEGRYLVYIDIKDSKESGTVYTGRITIPEQVEGRAEEVAVGMLKDAIKHKLVNLYREYVYESRKHLVDILNLHLEVLS